jgi:hypothetical protein
MSNDNGTATFTESPASWNTKYLDPRGYECQLTIRAKNETELLEKATKAIEYLLANACTPAVFFRNGTYKADSIVKEQEKSEVSTEENNHIEHNSSSTWCPIHQCEMKRWDKDGRVWYSHKVDGHWCKGKQVSHDQ